MEEEDYDRIDELFGSNEEISLALSFSRISDYDRNGPKALDKKTNVDGQGVKIGSIVDDWLFNKDNFKNLYEIYNGNKPTATLGKLVDIILENYASMPDKEEVFRIIQVNDFWKRSKQETIESYFDIPEFWEYLAVMFIGKERTIITSNEWLLSQDLCFTLQTHNYSKYIFEEEKGVDSIAQWKFSTIFNDTKLRGIVDLVKVDHNNRTIRFIDLKTGASPASEFMTSFMKYRYYFQSGIYYKLAMEEFVNEFNLKDYSFLPFQFLYIGRKERIPLVYTVSDKWINAAFNGFTTLGGYTYKGLNELVEEIKWHWSNKVFDIPKEVYENNGELVLKDNFFNVTQ